MVYEFIMKDSYDLFAYLWVNCRRVLRRFLYIKTSEKSDN